MTPSFEDWRGSFGEEVREVPFLVFFGVTFRFGCDNAITLYSYRKEGGKPSNKKKLMLYLQAVEYISFLLFSHYIA